MKIRINKILSIGLFIAFILSCTKSETPAPLIPMQDFFKNPVKSNFKISPNGKFYSFLSPWKSRMNIMIGEIDKDTIYQVTYKEDSDILNYFWANDRSLLYLVDEEGNEDYKLFMVDIAKSKTTCLTCFPGVKTEIIDDLKDNPNEIIVGLNKNNPEVFDPYKLNIETGELKQLANNPGNIVGWMTDHNGKLRAAYAIVDGINLALLYRETEYDEFKEVLLISWKDKFIPHFFTFDNKAIYASSNLGRDKLELVKFDPLSKSETEILYKNSLADITALSYSRKREVITTAYYYTSRQKMHFFDSKTEKMYERLHELLPEYDFVPTSYDKNETDFIIRTYSDKSRGAYYLYNSEIDKLIKLADISPWLHPEDLSEMKPIQYTSRDGLTIRGYLTLPKGRNPKDLPAVILPHGGPWLRDKWGFHPEVQFLANRGYAVLQMNFRGSTGFGKDFQLKSVKQWGKKMQDDISDGVLWLIDEGIANKDKIAIYGGSYGGYAALAGMTFTPELYACGIDYVGISNLFTFLNSIPPYWEPEREMWYELVGNPVHDSLLLAEASPVFHVDQIRAPLLIAQGANDPRVNKKESDQMVKALREKGIDVEYIVKYDEGHGFRKEENKFEFYKAVEDFLGKHIGDSKSLNDSISDK